MLHACGWYVFSILIPTPFPTPAFDFRAIGSFQRRSHSCPKAGSPRVQGPLSTAFCSEGYLAERGVVPGRRSQALWDQASSTGGRVWAEWPGSLSASAQVQQARQEGTVLMLHLAWPPPRLRLLLGENPLFQSWWLHTHGHRHALIYSRMITCFGGHCMDAAGTEGFVFK